MAILNYRKSSFLHNNDCLNLPVLNLAKIDFTAKSSLNNLDLLMTIKVITTEVIMFMNWINYVIVTLLVL